MQPTVGATVVTFRNPGRLASCLSALVPQTEAFGSEPYVVDNSDLPDRLYTRGVNVGLRHWLRREVDYLLVVCDDVRLRAGALAALVACLEKHPEAGIASPVQLDEEERVTCGGCTDCFPYGKHITEPLSHPIYSQGPYEHYWANGACFLLRSSLCREIGLLDEGMRFICSDADYSLTARSRGFRTLMAPAACVTHTPDRAKRQDDSALERVKSEDAIFFTQKWLTGGLFRGLAAEGPSLRPEQVQSHLQSHLAHLAATK